MPFDIASSQVLAQPVSGFMQGRALRLAQDQRASAETRAQEEHDMSMEQGKMQLGAAKAKQVYAGMQQVLAVPEGKRKQFIEENFPDLAKQMSSRGHDWASFDEKAITSMAEGISAHAAAELGIAPGKGEDFTLSPGQVRYEGGKKVAEAPLKPETMTLYQQAELKLGQDRLAFEKSKPTGADKPPMGYRYKDDGSLEFIPGGPADPSVSTNPRTLRPIPAAAAQGIVGNRLAIKQIDRALKAVDENPDAFGLQNLAPDALTQRIGGRQFSGGIDPRAQVADIGSMKIHDRSGAAVTAAEFPRLRPFIPASTDKADVVKKKLLNLRANADLMRDENESFYSADAGYRPLDSGEATRISGDADYAKLPSGAEYIGPDGKKRKKR